MHEAQLPAELTDVFDKPGADWTPSEKDAVITWLYTYQLRYLLVFALRNLGSYATREDAEDVWQEFMLKKWEGVVRNYDPAKLNDSSVEGSSRFLKYLRPSLRRACYDKAVKIRQESSRRQPETDHADTEGGDPMDKFPDGIQDTNEGFGDTGKRLEEDEEGTHLQACVGKALQRLARSHPLYHELVVMFYFKEMSQMEIAAKLNMTEINVRVKLHRARQTLKKYLSQERFGL